ncbi:hypothetical protein AHF37_00482 [Paragonimus kellicotti]|nr:hypothetical protein AHF37_00482 [Paragonimus kellicotti]
MITIINHDKHEEACAQVFVHLGLPRGGPRLIIYVYKPFRPGSIPINYGRSDVKSLLARIDHQVDVNAVNGAGNTALHIACQDPSLDCVEQLLNAGADPLVGVGELPLQLAVVADSIEYVDLTRRPFVSGHNRLSFVLLWIMV